MRPLKTLAGLTLAYPFERRKKSLWSLLRESKAVNDSTQCLRLLLPSHIEVNTSIVRQCLDELASADFIRDSVEKYKEVTGKGWSEKLSGRSCSAILFCFVMLRLTKPEIVVETGCATGWTSTLLLYALHCNSKGHLYSIDMPAKTGQFSIGWTLPQGLSIGFLLPEVLRDRWTLILGDAREHLMPLLSEQEEIDVFFHDSDHSYQHMMWEYTSVWPHLKRGGVLISDDIGLNTAFWDFALALKRPVVIHGSNPNFGALSKPI